MSRTVRQILFSFAILSLWAPGWWLGHHMSRTFGSVDSAPWILKLPFLILAILPPLVLVVGHHAIMRALDDKDEPLKPQGDSFLRPMDTTRSVASISDGHVELTFSMMSGVGRLVCADCGFDEQVVSYVHGYDNETLGFQCDACGRIEARTFDSGQARAQQSCGRCGGLLLRDKPVTCPNCRSSIAMTYEIDYVT